MKILLFIPTLGNINTQMATFLMKVKSKHNIEFMTTTRLLIHSARNLALEEMIKRDCEYLIMLDEDNPPTYDNFIDILINNNKHVVSGVVRLRNRKEDLNICYTEKVNGLDKYINYKNIDGLKELQEIENCGCGLVCLTRKVCEEMIKKYKMPFENKYTYYIKLENGKYIEFLPDIIGKEKFAINENGGLYLQARELSEDYLFFERVKQLGYKLYADTRIKTVHLGKQELLEV